MRAGWGWLALVWSLSSAAALPPAVQEALVRAQLPADSVAIVVQPLAGGAPLISHQASKAMNPASVMKLVTTYAALESLGTAYRWKTEVYRQGRLNQGVLDGDLMIKGSGDPALGIADFWRLLQQVQQQGIRQIKGNLVLDLSAYAPQVSQRPLLDDEAWRGYNANPSALLLNGRNTSFRFAIVGADAKPAVQVTQAFELPQVHVINTLQVRKGACNDWRGDLHYTVSPEADGVTVAFSGSLPDQCDEHYLELSVLSDVQYVSLSFKKLWAQLGGQFTGSVVLAPTPPMAERVTTWQSPPLDSVVRDINKWSNNVMARQLMLTLALASGAQPADEEAGVQALKQVLRQRNLHFPELVLENGSGLSRNERISAEHLAQLLVTAYQRPLMPVMMASLPVLGVDGTTRKRLADSPSQGMAYLKTGSLEGVSSLAGYVQDQQGKRYVLVMIANHPHAAAMRAVQDSLLKALIEGR